MAIVKPDIIDGNSGRFTIKGWEFSRVFIVSELTSRGDQMLVEAVTASGMPIYGEPHPQIPTAFAIEFNPESIPSNGNAVQVTVQYREFGQDYTIELGTRKLMVPTTDYFWTVNNIVKPMQLYYNYPADYKANEKLQGITEGQGVEIEVQQFFSTIVITRTEFMSILADALSGHPVGVKLTGEMLTDRGNIYNGSTNKAGWNLRPNDDADSWRCEMTAASAENGLAYRVRYAFSFDPKHWEAPATFKDPYTGEPVPDSDKVVLPRPVLLPIDYPLDGLAARRNFRVFKQQDFSSLELPR
jgi:hypothetical protein